MISYLNHLFVHHPGALDTLWLTHAWREHQHVTLSEQFLSSNLIKDCTAIDLTCYGKCDTRRNVCLDQSSNNIDTWALRRKHQVNSDRTSFLRKSHNKRLDISRRYHHKICKLIDNNHDIRHRSILMLLSITVFIFDGYFLATVL